MKTRTRWKIILPLILTHILILTSLSLYSQTPPPGHEWKKVTWRDKDITNTPGLSQALSGDEWWYGHKNLYDPNNPTQQIGYLAYGYLADLVHPGDEQKIRDLFNEGSDAPSNGWPAGSYFTDYTAYNVFDAGCREFYDNEGPNKTPPTSINEGRTPFRGMISRLDLQGNMTWCRLL